MRIIDKNYDYYDYLQNSDDKIVFDRRGSFLLTKEKVMEQIEYVRYGRDSKYRFMLLQCGATYWLFLLTVTEYEEKQYYSRVKNYSLELLTSWKYYNKPREKVDISLISFRESYIFYDYDYYVPTKDFSVDRIKSRLEDMKNRINADDYYKDRDLTCPLVSGSKTEKAVPLLKACGISQLVGSTDIFCAIEEHFSLEKTESEKTEAGGTTNNDKVTMHGFDIKTSFRNKATGL